MRMMRPFMVVALIAVVGACARDGARPEQAEQQPARRESAAPPADSKLAKVRQGMTVGEVEDTLGRPSDQNEYITGKAFIPWYFGRDRNRVAYFYKGLGRVVFEGAGGFSRNFKVHHVEYDPNEPGRAR